MATAPRVVDARFDTLRNCVWLVLGRLGLNLFLLLWLTLRLCLLFFLRRLTLCLYLFLLLILFFLTLNRGFFSTYYLICNSVGLLFVNIPWSIYRELGLYRLRVKQPLHIPVSICLLEPHYEFLALRRERNT